jgi:hypothetical protein
MKPIVVFFREIRKYIVAAFVVFSIYNMHLALSGSQNIGDTGSERLNRWEADMQLVRKTLPVERGLIGYISEEELEGVEYAFWDNETEFILTQYALAPLILKKGLAAEWNIVVLRREYLEMWLEANPGEYEIIEVKGQFHLLRDLGEQ